MMRATFVDPSRLSLSARPMSCTISTCEPRVSAKHTAYTLAGDVDAFLAARSTSVTGSGLDLPFGGVT
ncbi:hypothetical protein ACIRP7_22935 [Streptomyces sp. NPDC102270]|uniref:hypothetical protein n=1 Tax=Streptomyces sp. NPDC102270 TaxID=3366150 RepID=UPI0038156126